MTENVKKLILLRHAKSDWDAPYNTDFERPLNERGKLTAPLIGNYAKEKGHIPDLVFCSTALRTRQTLEFFTSGLGQKIEAQFHDSLYGANTQDINTLIKTCPQNASTLMIIAHNPGLGAMAYNLSPEKTDLFGKFPTASFAVFTFQSDNWQNFDYGPSENIDFIKPRDLA